jgi:acyl dehydratase
MAAKHFPVEASHILMFARSIGDTNPVYQDAEQAAASEVEGIIAPPTFVQSSAQFDPGYGLRPRPGVPWFGSAKHASGLMGTRPSAATAESTPAPAAPAASAKEGAATEQSGGGSASRGGGGGGLHAEQHYEYHRHLRPGDVLTSKSRAGETWERESPRAGKLRFRETITEYYDQTGELVITARGVGMSTERVIDPGKPVEKK